MGQIELVELLSKRVGFLEQERFTNSGAEAIRLAIRVARTFTGKNLIVKIEGGYYGTHDLVCAGAVPELASAKPTTSPRTMPLAGDALSPNGSGVGNSVQRLRCSVGNPKCHVG